MSDTSLVPRKDLASLFLNVDHTKLCVDAFPELQSGQPLPRHEIESFLGSKVKALTEWHASIATQYRDAFERSHRVVNNDVQRQNFEELKRIYRSGLGLHAFSKGLLEGRGEVSEKAADNKLEKLKKERQRLSGDNASLVASLAAQNEELATAFTEVQSVLHDVARLQPLDGAIEQFHREQSELQAGLSRAEQDHMELTAEIGSHASRGCDLDREIQQETTECTLLRGLIGKYRQDALVEDNERERINEETERDLKEMEVIANLLKKIGGTDITEMNGNRLTLSIRTDTATNEEQMNKCSFVHQLTLELHPTTLLVEGIQLEPDEGIHLDVIRGKALKMAVASVRSLLFLSLNQRAHLESLKGYAFIRVDSRRGIWRVALLEHIEVEFMLPVDWPYNKEAEVKLLDIQSANSSVNIAHVREKVRSVQFRDPQSMIKAVLSSLREQ